MDEQNFSEDNFILDDASISNKDDHTELSISEVIYFLYIH
jgi:hypothetical protein